MVLKRHKVFEQLVAGSTDHFDRAVSFDSFFHRTDRGKVGRTARIACSIIAIYDVKRVTLAQFQQIFAFGKILVSPSSSIIIAMRQHDGRTVDALPQTNQEGMLAVSKEGIMTPIELLRRKTDQSAMAGNGRQCPSETKTVRQEYIRTFHAELFAVVFLPERNITDKRFGRRNQRVGRIPATAGDMPASVLYVFLHLLVLGGVIFLHPGIFNSTLEVEHIIGIAFQQE